jgi:hypothetical protein
VIAAYLPSLPALAGLASVLAIAACLLGVGRLVTPGEVRPEASFVAGYGAVLIAVTLVGTATALPLIWSYRALIVVGLAGLVVHIRRRDSASNDVVRALALALPLLVVICAAAASQWDEFSNWLPKHRYLLDWDAFTRPGMPPSLSVFPAYPEGLPLIGYFAGRTAGMFIENAGALFNTFGAVIAGLLIARCAVAGASGDPQTRRRLPWGLIALGLLGATALNPTFVPKLVFTAYVDWMTAVTLAVAAVAGWRGLEALAAGEPAAARQDALTAGLALAVLVDLKQANLVLAVLLCAGFALALLRATPQPIAAAMRLLPALVLPAAVIYLAWRAFVSLNITGGEFHFLPYRDWLWDSLGEILLRMAGIAAGKGGYFALMLLFVGCALRALVRPATAFGRFAIIVATVFVGYNAFLYVAYVGAFGAGEGRAAASYWRYNTQLGVLAVGAAALGLGTLWRRHAGAALVRRLSHPAMAALAIALVAAGPVLAAHRLRFDINPAKTYVRAVGRAVGDLLPQGSRLTVIDRRDNGLWALLVRYEVGRRGTVDELSGAVVGDPNALRAALAQRPRPTYVWVHVPEPSIDDAIGLALAPRSSYLLARTDGAWRVLGSWPWPGYDDPEPLNK